MRLRHFLYALLAILLLPVCARANEGARGWCELGGQLVVTSGLNSTSKVQASYPSCTITVSIHGGGLATIFSDNNNTPLSNPFVSQTNGQWLFFAANGRYDVVLSGGGLPSTVTYSDIILFDGGTSGALFGTYQAVTFSATPTFNAAQAQIFDITLTGNVTSSTVSNPVQAGEVLDIHICQDATGGRTWTWPANFLDQPVVQSNPSVCQGFPFAFNGSSWYLFASASSGGATPAAPGLSLQIANANATALTAIPGFGVDAGSTKLFLPLDLQPSGLNPYIDIRQFGARAVTSVPATTITINAGSATGTLVSAAGFQIGDGIDAIGAGPANALTIPSALTVTPSQPDMMAVGAASPSPAGALSQCYQVAAEDQGYGVTAVSGEICTSTGQALGATTLAVTSCSLSGVLETCTTTSNHTIAVGAGIVLTGTTLNTINNNYARVTAVTSNTFTFPVGLNSALGSNGSATGGTVKWFQENLLTWTGHANDYQYCIYGRGATGTETWIGATGISNGGTAQTFWDDYGSPISNQPRPAGCPVTPPVAPVADYLPTTITGLVGNTVTLATAASTGVSGAAFQLDVTPNLKLAKTAAGGNGIVVVPAVSSGTFVINSVPDFSIGSGIHLIQNGAFTINATMQFGNQTVWEGVSGLTQLCGNFNWFKGVCNSGSAYPMVFFVNTNSGTVVRELQFNTGANGWNIQANGAFESQWENLSFALGCCGNDYVGKNLVVYGAANVSILHSSFSTGTTPTTVGQSNAPNLLLTSVPSNAPGSTFIKENSFVARGIGLYNSAAFGTGQIVVFGNYFSGMSSPTIAAAGSGNSANFVMSYKQNNGDTFSVPDIVSWSATLNNSEVTDTRGNNIVITGQPILGLRTANNQGLLTQTSDYNLYSATGFYRSASPWNTYAFRGFQQSAELLNFPVGHTASWSLPAPTGLAAAVAVGGSLSVGTHNYAVWGVSASGGWGLASANVACTTSTGNQTCNLTWTALAGAIAYRVAQDSNGSLTTSDVTTNSLSVTSNLPCCQLNPQANPGPAGGGITEVNALGLYGPQLVLTSLSPTTVSFTGILVAGSVNTANRTYTLPDFTGTVCISAGVCNATLLNGATFASPGAIGSTTPAAATFTTITSATSSPAASGFLRLASGDIINFENNAGNGVVGISHNATDQIVVPALAISGISGSVQCLHVNSSGIVSGTGSDCGSGGTGSSIFSQWQFGTQTALTGPNLFIQLTGSAFFTETQTGAGTNVSPFVDTFGVANAPAGTLFSNNSAVSATPAYQSIIVLGVAATTQGTLSLCNSAVSGTCTLIQNLGATAAFNFNLPSTAGATNFLLTSQGGGTSPMTWTSNVTTIDGTACSLGASCTPHQFQTNAVNNALQTVVNFITSTVNTDNLTVTPVNPAATGNERFEITGTLNALGGGTGLSSPTPHSLFVAEGASPASLITSPTLNGLYICGFNVTSNVAVDPTCGLQGIPVVSNSGTTVTLTAAADVTVQKLSNSSPIAVAGPPLASNITFALLNTNTGTATYTPNSGTVNGNATALIPNGWFAFEYTDNTTTTMPILPTQSAFPNCGAACALNFNSVTGVIGTTTSIVTGTGVANDLASFLSAGVIQDSGIVAANVVTDTTTLTAGQVALGNGTKTITSGATLTFSSTTLTVGQAATGTGAVAFVGTTSGTVNLTVNAAAGTWTMTLPTSGGTNGQFLQTNGSGVTSWASPTGSGTVNAGTTPRLAYYATSSTAVSDTGANLTWNTAGALTIGVNATTTGQLVLANGNASGVSVTLQNLGATTPYNFNLPTTSGNAGDCLKSGGGGTNPMTFGACGGSSTSVQNSFTAGTVTSGNLACFTSSGTIGNCTVFPAANFIGVFFNGSGGVQSQGSVTVNLDATVSVTFGDIICASSLSATGHDNGSVACANGEWVGIVTTTAASVSSATVYLRLQ